MSDILNQILVQTGVATLVVGALFFLLKHWISKLIDQKFNIHFQKINSEIEIEKQKK